MSFEVIKHPQFELSTSTVCVPCRILCSLQELDFDTEVENAERCRKHFSSRKGRLRESTHVPEIDLQLSSKRVITMEYITGMRLIILSCRPAKALR